MGKRELIALLNLSSWCLVMVEWLFLAVPLGCLQFVVFPDHTHLLFLLLAYTKYCCRWGGLNQNLDPLRAENDKCDKYPNQAHTLHFFWVCNVCRCPPPPPKEKKKRRTLSIYGLKPSNGRIRITELYFKYIFYLLNLFQCNAGLANYKMFEYLQQPPTKLMLLGCGCSTETESTAQVSHMFNITQVKQNVSAILDMQTFAIIKDGIRFWKLFVDLSGAELYYILRISKTCCALVD